MSRIAEAAVLVDDRVVGELDGPGLLVLVGVTYHDGPAQAETMARKLHELRILRDERSACERMTPSRATNPGNRDLTRLPT